MWMRRRACRGERGLLRRRPLSPLQRGTRGGQGQMLLLVMTVDNLLGRRGQHGGTR